MQEPLENLSGGTEPKQMLMVLEDDLVDKLNPGDKVRITGTLKTFREERSGKSICEYFIRRKYKL